MLGGTGGSSDSSGSSSSGSESKKRKESSEVSEVSEVSNVSTVSSVSSSDVEEDGEASEKEAPTQEAAGCLPKEAADDMPPTKEGLANLKDFLRENQLAASASPASEGGCEDNGSETHDNRCEEVYGESPCQDADDDDSTL